MAKLDHYITQLTQRMIDQGKISYEINYDLPLLGNQETLWTRLAEVTAAALSVINQNYALEK